MSCASTDTSCGKQQPRSVTHGALTLHTAIAASTRGVCEDACTGWEITWDAFCVTQAKELCTVPHDRRVLSPILVGLHAAAFLLAVTYTEGLHCEFHDQKKALQSRSAELTAKRSCRAAPANAGEARLTIPQPKLGGHALACISMNQQSAMCSNRSRASHIMWPLHRGCLSTCLSKVGQGQRPGSIVLHA